MGKPVELIILLFLFFNFALPKAGTKIEGFPLYISLFLSFFIILPLILFHYIKIIKNKEEKISLIYSAILIIILFIEILFYKPDSIDANLIINYYLPFIVSLISIFFIFLAKYYPLKSNQFRNVIIVSFAIISIYGIVQKVFGDFKTIIPGITFNYSEAVTIDLSMLDKNNIVDTLQYYKLSSTYQNGNLFGVNYIMISWFAFYFLKSNFQKSNLQSYKSFRMHIFFYISMITYICVCLLTGSATVYIGMFTSLVLLYFNSTYEISFSAGKKRSNQLLLLIIIPSIIIAGLIIVLNFFPELRDLINQRLLKRNLLANDRIKYLLLYLHYLWDNKLIFQFLFGTLFDAKRVGFAYEITLASVFLNFGLIFTVFFVYYIFNFIKKLKLTVYNIGIFSYILVSFLDGGFWLPPTPISFFTLLGFSYYLMPDIDRGQPEIFAKNQSDS